MHRMTHAAMLRERYLIEDYVVSEKIYRQYPIKVTRCFREGLLDAFPALTDHQHALAYRNMLEYILYALLRDEEGRLVFPAETLAALVGARVGSNGFAALDYLNGFSRDIFPLIIGEYIPHKKARCIAYETPEIIQSLTENDRGAALVADQDKVWLVSGLPVTVTGRRKAAARYEEGITTLTDGVDSDHPAYELQQHLNTQSQVPLGKCLRRNWHRLLAMHGEMEEGDGKNSAGYVLLALEDWAKNLYGGSERTVRISTRGTTIHTLPREMRKAALAGSMEFDIRSSQAAIVSKLWGLSELSSVLASRTSFWTIMLEHLALSETAKPALKSALYSACFGMGKMKLMENLSAEIGHEKAEAFFAHSLMAEIMAGRSAAMKRVKESGGVTDAFGRYIELSSDNPAHALLAIEAQSWELRLMLPIFEAVKDVRNVSILSWLHDGVVIHYPQDETMRLGLVARVVRAFDTHAAALGFATALEMDCL